MAQRGRDNKPMSANTRIVPKHRRLTAEERRDRTLDLVTEVFAEKGLARTTTAELAEAAGVSQAMLFKIFGDKRGIYLALVDREVSEGGELFPQEAADAGNDELFFGIIAEAFLRRLEERPAFVRLFLHSALEGEDFLQLFHEARSLEVLGFIAKYIRRRICEEAFRPVDPDVAALGFLGMLFQHALAKQVFHLPNYSPSRKAVAKTFVQIILRGLARRSLELNEERGEGLGLRKLPSSQG